WQRRDPLTPHGGQGFRRSGLPTEGGVKQAWERKRKADREVTGTGRGRTLKWNRKALLNYTQCRTGKGRLGMWRYTLDPWEDPTCREEGCDALETGKHVALSCISGEWLGRRWSSWEQADNREVWRRKEKKGDKEVVIDLVEGFFTA